MHEHAPETKEAEPVPEMKGQETPPEPAPSPSITTTTAEEDASEEDRVCQGRPETPPGECIALRVHWIYVNVLISVYHDHFISP